MPVFLSHRTATDESIGADLLVVPIAESAHGVPARLARLGKGVADAVARALDLGDFEREVGSVVTLRVCRIERYPRILLLRLGSGEEPESVGVRRAFAKASKDPLFRRIDSVAVWAEPSLGSGAALAENVAAAIDGLLEGTYRWTAATTKKESPAGRYLFLADGARSLARVDEGIAHGRALGDSVLLAREIANTPANRMGPAEMAERAKEIAAEAGLACRVLAGTRLARERMEAIRTVGAGSARDPRLIVLEYDPGVDLEPIVLVGKGLVYDTGGLSLKPTSSMVGMKFDKCGGSVVLAVLRAAATLDLPLPLVGIVPAVENSVSGTSYRPGDVIGSRSGQTIDVQNTDAEGRLVLADAIDYGIDKYSPRALIDIATLTGAAYYALGDRACAVLGTDDGVVERLREAGERSGERVWPLPLWAGYRKDVDSPVADVRNTGPWGAGTITGAAFLQRFTRDVPWAHLDIASVSYDRRETKNGATGFGVRLLVEALRRWPKRRGRGR
jgi:leucyl aminopeptidase